MSFTQDELQAFNSILEQKLAAHRREMERSLEQRMAMLKRDFEQRLTALQRDILHRLPQRIVEQQKFANQAVQDEIKPQEPAQEIPQVASAPQDETAQPIAQAIDPAQQLESAVERGLAAQLLAIEQLINQRLPAQPSEWPGSYLAGALNEQGGIEIQTDLPWDELAQVVDNALDRRIVQLKESLQANIKDMVDYLSVELNTIRGDLARLQMPGHNGDITSMHEVFTSIEQLERIIESMQVAMNANHALLSNRMFHHQQLPLERAHAGNTTTAPLAARTASASSTTKPLPVLNGHESEPQQS